jgi:excisionase family DNA binding protein
MEAGNEQLLTIAEVAVLLRVSKWSVYQLIWSGQLNTLTIGRRRLVRPSAYAECVALLEDRAALWPGDAPMGKDRSSPTRVPGLGMCG